MLSRSSLVFFMNFLTAVSYSFDIFVASNKDFNFLLISDTIVRLSSFTSPFPSTLSYKLVVVLDVGFKFESGLLGLKKLLNIPLLASSDAPPFLLRFDRRVLFFLSFLFRKLLYFMYIIQKYKIPKPKHHFIFSISCCNVLIYP